MSFADSLFPASAPACAPFSALDLDPHDGQRHCAMCDRWRPTSAFTKNRAAPGGLERRCRTCRAVARAVDRAARTGEVRALDRERQRRRHWADPEASRERIRRRRRHGGPAVNLLRTAAGRATFGALLARFGHACAYCGRRDRKLGLDHFVALAHGGATGFENVVPACRTCNFSKGRRFYPGEWRPLDPDARPNLAALAPYIARAAQSGA